MADNNSIEVSVFTTEAEFPGLEQVNDGDQCGDGKHARFPEILRRSVPEILFAPTEFF